MDFDGIPLALADVDPSGQVRSWSAAFASLVGHADTPANLADLLAVEERAHLDAVLAEPGLERAVAGLRSDGFPFRMVVAAAPADDGFVVEAEVAEPPLFDLEHAADAPSPSKGPVDAAVSHDLRGALRGVSGFLTLLEREIELNEEATGYLDTIRRSAATADEMSRALVDWMRLLRSPMVLEPQDLGVIVADAVDRTVAITAELPDGAAPEGALALEVGELPRVQGSRALLLAAVAELLTNAQRFAGGDVVVSVSADVTDGWCYLRVADNGPGVAAHLAEDAFALFRLLQPKGIYPGVGMGLPLSRRRIEVQGGRLWIESSDEPGTTVVARLALA